jgi:endonuclease YncB( thermonuclease family)
MRLLSLVTVAAAVTMLATAVSPDAKRAQATHPSCTVERVIDGDTFVCTDGTHVRMLQVDAIELSECGGNWSRDALANIFLKPGTFVRLDYDEVTEDRYGRHLAAPIVRGADGNDYNISIVMVYVGLARAGYYGDNEKYLLWARASQRWAQVAQWNMWAPGGPYNGGC